MKYSKWPITPSKMVNFNNLFWVNFSRDEINRIFEVWHAHNFQYLLDASTCSLKKRGNISFKIGPIKLL
jgi:hypothetical protein